MLEICTWHDRWIIKIMIWSNYHYLRATLIVSRFELYESLNLCEMDPRPQSHKFLLQEFVFCASSLLWRCNGRDGVSNHQPPDCLLNLLVRRRSKKTSKLRVTGLSAGWPMNSPHKGPVTRKMFPIDDVMMCASFGASLSLNSRSTVTPHPWLITYILQRVSRLNGALGTAVKTMYGPGQNM